MAKRKHVKKQYAGTDGHLYKGKAVKKRHRLESRIASFNKSMGSATLESCKKKCLHMPGSMK